MHHRRFLLSSPPLANQATLSGDEAHHLIHVLRAEIGDSIELIDGSGSVWRGEVAELDSASVKIRNLVDLPQEDSTIRRILVQSLCKADKLEWILQKTTELGVSEIRLLDADRSVLKIPNDKVQRRLERWNKIILGAAKQSRRAWIPEITPVASVGQVAELIGKAACAMVLEPGATASLGRLSLPESGDLLVVVGPEGGITGEESTAFGAAGAMACRLGPTVLRTSTAGTVAAAILLTRSGRWS